MVKVPQIDVRAVRLKTGLIRHNLRRNLDSIRQLCEIGSRAAEIEVNVSRSMFYILRHALTAINIPPGI